MCFLEENQPNQAQYFGVTVQERSPNQRPPNNPQDIQRIALFMNGFLSVENLDSLPCPVPLRCDYQDLDGKGKEEWFVHHFHALFRDAAIEVAGLLGRQLSLVELNLIRRRIINFFKKLGIEYHGDL